MTAWERPAMALSALVALSFALVVAWRRGRLGLSFLAVAVVLAGLWVAAKLAVRSDYRDADGYVDCWPSCTALQDGVALAIWFGPVAFGVLGVLAAVLAALTGPRAGGRGDNEPRLHSGSSPS